MGPGGAGHAVRLCGPPARSSAPASRWWSSPSRRCPCARRLPAARTCACAQSAAALTIATPDETAVRSREAARSAVLDYKAHCPLSPVDLALRRVSIGEALARAHTRVVGLRLRAAGGSGHGGQGRGGAPLPRVLWSRLGLRTCAHARTANRTHSAAPDHVSAPRDSRACASARMCQPEQPADRQALAVTAEADLELLRSVRRERELAVLGTRDRLAVLLDKPAAKTS